MALGQGDRARLNARRPIGAPQVSQPEAAVACNVGRRTVQRAASGTLAIALTNSCISETRSKDLVSRPARTGAGAGMCDLDDVFDQAWGLA
jgi:hypothetical protein